MLTAHFVAPEADKRNWSVRGLEMRLEKAIAYTEHRLGDAPFLTGKDLSLADISVACGLGMWSGALGLTLPGSIVAWRERLAARPAYRSATARNESAAAPA